MREAREKQPTSQWELSGLKVCGATLRQSHQLKEEVCVCVCVCLLHCRLLLSAGPLPGGSKSVRHLFLELQTPTLPRERERERERRCRSVESTGGLFWFDRRQHGGKTGKTHHDHLKCCCSDASYIPLHPPCPHRSIKDWSMSYRQIEEMINKKGVANFASFHI